MDSVQRLLQTSGPMISADLAATLVDNGSATNLPSARKMIERALTAKAIKSTAPVRFNKSYLYYLESHQGKQYAQAVRKVLPLKPSFQRVFKTILANKGWITASQIGKSACCLPKLSHSTAGGRLPLEEVIAQLLSLKLIDKVAGENDLYRIGTPFGSFEVKRAAFQRKLELEQGLLKMLRDWIRNCYLIAYEKHSIRSSAASATEFNDTLWDLHGPIYFGPFSTSKSIGRPSKGGSFIVAEVLGYRTFSTIDAEATCERANGIGHRWKSIALVPIVIAPAFSREAWKQLREAGVIAVTHKDVFGSNIDELIRRFSIAISSDEPTDENMTNVEQSLAVTQGTIADEGLLGNLKGALFELLVAMGFRALGFETTLQKKIRLPAEGEEYEIDIAAIKGDQLCKMVECKGRHEKYWESQEEVERHFLKRCCAAADPYGWNVTNIYKKTEAVFITSGRFTPETIIFANSTKVSHGIECTIIDRVGLIELLEEAEQSRLIGIIKQYY